MADHNDILFPTDRSFLPLFVLSSFFSIQVFSKWIGGFGFFFQPRATISIGGARRLWFLMLEDINRRGRRWPSPTRRTLEAVPA